MMREEAVIACTGVNPTAIVVDACTSVAAGVAVIDPTEPVSISESASVMPLVFCMMLASDAVLTSTCTESVVFFCGGLGMLVICTMLGVLVLTADGHTFDTVILLFAVSVWKLVESDVTPAKRPSPEKEIAEDVTGMSDGNVSSTLQPLSMGNGLMNMTAIVAASVTVFTAEPPPCWKIYAVVMSAAVVTVSVALVPESIAFPDAS